VIISLTVSHESAKVQNAETMEASMAYLNKGDMVMIRDGGIVAFVTDIQWRKFRRSAEEIARMKRKNPDKPVRITKNVPYAVCKVAMAETLPVGTGFLIPGYKLKFHEKKDGDTILVLDGKYAAEFSGEWVEKILAASKASVDSDQ
jgi:hypothetical protein